MQMASSSPSRGSFLFVKVGFHFDFSIFIHFVTVNHTVWYPLCCSMSHQIVLLDLYLVISILCLHYTFPGVNTDVTLQAQPNVSQIQWLIRGWKWLAGSGWEHGMMAVLSVSLSFAMASSQTTSIVSLNCFLLSISSGATVGSVSICKGPLGYNCVTSGLCWYELRFCLAPYCGGSDNDSDGPWFMTVMSIMVMDHGLWWSQQLLWWTLIYDNDVDDGDRHGLWWLQQLWWWWCRWCW